MHEIGYSDAVILKSGCAPAHVLNRPPIISAFESQSSPASTAIYVRLLFVMHTMRPRFGVVVREDVGDDVGVDVNVVDVVGEVVSDEVSVVEILDVGVVVCDDVTLVVRVLVEDDVPVVVGVVISQFANVPSVAESSIAFTVKHVAESEILISELGPHVTGPTVWLRRYSRSIAVRTEASAAMHPIVSYSPGDAPGRLPLASLTQDKVAEGFPLHVEYTFCR